MVEDIICLVGVGELVMVNCSYLIVVFKVVYLL